MKKITSYSIGDYMFETEDDINEPGSKRIEVKKYGEIFVTFFVFTGTGNHEFRIRCLEYMQKLT